jgi:predicted nucleic acid-binding protein
VIAYVDANVILRYLIGEPPDMFEKVVSLMDSVEKGDVTLRVEEITVAEVVWVLSTSYKMRAPAIETKLLEFLSREGLVVDEGVFSALVLYGSKGVDFADALLAARSLHNGPRQVYSFDKHFDRVAGLERLEPGAVK